MPDELIINVLKEKARNYDGVTKTLVAAKNRHQALFDTDPKSDATIHGLESIKGRLSREIGKYLEYWPIWEKWLSNVNGVGPFMGANLIVLYYYRFIPVCQKCLTPVEKKEKTEDERGAFFCPKCKKSIKDQGKLKYHIEGKDFATISKWWKYMGEAIDEETGRKERRAKGKPVRFSPKGRTLSFLIGESFVKQSSDSPYRSIYKTYREKGDRHSVARMKTSKIFLSHFWVVARTIDGKETGKPYVEKILGHDNISKPFYWDGEPIEELNSSRCCEEPVSMAAMDTSHVHFETQEINASLRECETH